VELALIWLHPTKAYGIAPVESGIFHGEEMGIEMKYAKKAKS
jgi:hypothetical protein